MSTQKSLTQFFKPLQSGGVKRSFAELVSGSKQDQEVKTPKTNLEDVKVR